MRPFHDVWNILHDGRLAEFFGHIPGDVSFRVEIPYLRRMFCSEGSSIWVHLRQCDILHFTDMYKKTVGTDIKRILEGEPEVLSAASSSDAVTVFCTTGWLFLRYDSARYELDDDVIVSFTALEAASRKYWDDWSAKSKPQKGP